MSEVNGDATMERVLEGKVELKPLEEVLYEKRRLERADELKQIDSLGKVEILKERLDRKLGRNLAMKLSTGPLGRKNRRLSQSHSIKRKKRGWVREKMSRRVFADGEASDYLIGQITSPGMKRQQEKELKELEEMSIVRNKSNHSDRAKVKHHIQNHVARMYNHRLMIRPTSGTSKGGKAMESGKKSSILVTTMDDSEERVRELHRQQSRVLIESMIQCPSRQHRVLQKLNSEQQRKISVVEEAKISWRKVSREMQEDGADMKMCLTSPPPATADMAMTSPSRIWSETTPLLPGLVNGVSSDYEEKEKDNYRNGSDCDDETDGMVGVCMDEVRYEPTVDVAKTMVVSDGGTDNSEVFDDAGFMANGNGNDDDDDDAAVQRYSDVSEGVAAVAPLSLDALPPSPRLQSPLPPLHLPAREEEKPVRISCDTYELADKEDSLSWAASSTESSETSLDKPTPLHLSHSSPQFPLGSSLMSALGTHTGAVMTHGTYGTIEVEIDPFSREFKLGPRSDDGDIKYSFPIARKSSKCTRRSPQASISRQLSDTLFSPIPLTIECGQNRIPSKAFQDPDFLLYVKQLGCEPEVSDYITYKMRVIGDRIEKRYSKELNQAMDDVFYELLKQNLSWSTFSSVSRRLLVGGARIQDGILLVPCFARRLMDMVPHLDNTIGYFTEKILDNYASDSILGMGGWSSFMESYEEFSGEEDEEMGSSVDLVAHPQLPAHASMLSPNATGYATLPNLKTFVNTQPHSLDLPAVTVSDHLESKALKPHPQPVWNFALRRCNSVEVLFPEEEELNDLVSKPPPTHIPIYTRSVSTSSLDLATPSPVPSNRACTLKYSHKNTIIATDSSPLTPGMPSLGSKGFGLPSLPEESRLSSRRSSVCSSIIMIDHSHLEVEFDVTDGFEVIGRMGGNPEREQHSSKNSDSDTNPSGQTGSGGSPLSEEGELITNEDVDSTLPKAGEVRRRSSADIAAPLAVATAHLVVLGCYFLAKQ